MDFEKQAKQLHENNIIQWKMEEGGQSCQACIDLKVDYKAKLFSKDFLRLIMERIHESTGCTIEIPTLPITLIERGDKMLSVSMKCRKMSAQWVSHMSPMTYGEFSDTAIEFRQIVGNKISTDIIEELAAHKVESGDELILCLYKLPVLTPTIFSGDDFTPRRGIMMRYAKALFPKNGEPFVLE